MHQRRLISFVCWFCRKAYTWMIRKALAMVEPQVGVVNEATMNGCTKLPKALQQSRAQVQGPIATATPGAGALQVTCSL
jgi:hypothetical protein